MENCLYIYNNKPNIFPCEKTILELFEEKINECLKENKKLSIYCAVGFFFFEGLEALIPSLKKLYKRGLLKKFKLIMGRETKATTKEVLELIKKDATNLSKDKYLFIKELYDKGIFEFRIFLDRRFHIKLYLFEENDVLSYVWAGSANLTLGGLKDNIELVVPTGVSPKERKFYKKLFEILWKKSTDEVEKLKTIEIIKKGATSEAIYLSPREFFINLIKLMNKEYLLSTPTTGVSYLAEFQNLSYFMCLEKLNKWGGVILGNSVGLGKTDISCAIAKYYVDNGKRVLIIHPPSVEHQWKSTLKKVGLDINEENIKLLSIGLLQKKNFDVRSYNNYDLIIIDEAHNVRNTSSNRRKNLEDLIKVNLNCHTLLVTATPINTSIENFTSLLNLFALKEKYKEKLENKGILLQIDAIENCIRNKKIAEAVKFVRELIKEFVVRFEWIDILKYFKNDLEKIAGISDFKLPDVYPVEYRYNKKINKDIFNRIVDYLEKLNYEYAKLWEEGGYKEDKNLIFWHKWRLYKRLESSIFAFKKSLEKFKERNVYLLELFKKLDENQEIDIDNNNYLFDKNRLENIKNIYSSLSNRKKEKVKENIKIDIKLTEKFLEQIKRLEEELIYDEKVKKLIEILRKENKPTIIFSESRDTVLYLKKKLKNKEFKKIAIAYGGEVGNKEINKAKIQKEFNEGKYDILITTDVLSEGVNLPRADVIINFDLPYNPVRLIQRAGRAVRLSNPKYIKIYNFKPDSSIDKELEICNRLKARVEDIASTIGIEFMIWSINEDKVKEFSEKNRKRVEEAIKEWKQKLASSNPEELSKVVISTIDEIDKVLREYINYYLISKESLENIEDTYKKIIYTSLAYEKDGYFILYEYGGNIYHCGKLYFSPNERKELLEIEEIKKLVEQSVSKLDEKFLRTSQEIRSTKTLRSIKKILENININERDISNLLEKISFLDQQQQKQVLSYLQKNKNSLLFLQCNKKYNVILGILKKFNTSSQLSIYNLYQENKRYRIIAVIKYKSIAT